MKFLRVFSLIWWFVRRSFAMLSATVTVLDFLFFLLMLVLVFFGILEWLGEGIGLLD